MKKYKKEELELLSNKDITNLLLEEKGKQKTADLFKKIIKLLELPESTFEEKIADYYTALSTDKRFVLLNNGTWDLRNRQKSDMVIKAIDEDEDEEDEEEIEEKQDEEDLDDDSDNYDDKEDEEYDEETNEELKDLVIIDEDELELEQ